MALELSLPEASDLLRRAGAEVRFCSLGEPEVPGSHGIIIRAEDTLETLDFAKLDMLVLPGGMRGTQNVLDSEKALELIRRAWDSGKYVAAICAGPTVLARLGIGTKPSPASPASTSTQQGSRSSGNRSRSPENGGATRTSFWISTASP